MPVNSDIRLIGSASIQAAPGKARRLNMLAYSSPFMRVGNWGNVALALDGIQFGRTIPVLAEHRNELAAVIGKGEPEVRDGALYVNATLADTPAAASVVTLLNSGVPLQCSVGIEPTATRRLKGGEQITVNGRTLTTPPEGATLVVRGTLREVSILPQGADDQTDVSLAAARKAAQLGDKTTMEPETTTTTDTTPDEIKAERQRVTDIDSAAKDFPAIRAEAIRDGWTVERTKAACLDELRASRRSPFGIRTGSSGPTVNPTDLISAATLRLMGKADVAERQISANAAQAAAEARCRNLKDLCATALRAEGMEVPRDDNAMIKAAFSTVSLANALGNAAETLALDEYKSAPATWRSFAKLVPVQNFRETSLIRANWTGGFTELGPDGELKTAPIGESVYSIKAGTFGQIFTLTRQHIVNDDLGVLTGAAAALGRAGARAVADSLYRLILSNPNSYFALASGNYQEGAGTALSVSSLSLAVKMMRVQTDPNGRPIDLVPRTLIVPPELETHARQIVNSTTVERWVDETVDNVPAGNPFSGSLKIEVEPRLSNSSFTGYSATAWLLAASPQDAPFTVAFVGGAEAPVIETVDPGPNVLGIGYRGYLDFGVAAGDPRAMVKSKGAANPNPPIRRVTSLPDGAATPRAVSYGRAGTKLLPLGLGVADSRVCRPRLKTAARTPHRAAVIYVPRQR